MELYAILRRTGWSSPAELQEAAARSTRVGNEDMPNEVRWIRSYVLDEGAGSVGTICIYEATGPDAVRKHAKLAGLPRTRSSRSPTPCWCAPTRFAPALNPHHPRRAWPGYPRSRPPLRSVVESKKVLLLDAYRVDAEGMTRYQKGLDGKRELLSELTAQCPAGPVKPVRLAAPADACPPQPREPCALAMIYSSPQARKPILPWPPS